MSKGQNTSLSNIFPRRCVLYLINHITRILNSLHPWSEIPIHSLEIYSSDSQETTNSTNYSLPPLIISGQIRDNNEHRTMSSGGANNKAAEKMKLAPIRSVNDFILDSKKYLSPPLSDMKRFNNRLTSNLLYYQTNYFAFSFVVFVLVS